jgi:uncharacterized membrane protein YciS (DUF1049 family)
MLRRLFLFFIIILALAVTAMFAAINPGTVTVDLAFRAFETQKALAFTVAFGLGWGFGILCAGLALLKSTADRRRLKRGLKLAESEVSALRSMPMQDAD